MTPAGLKEIARYADGIGVPRTWSSRATRPPARPASRPTWSATPTGSACSCTSGRCAWRTSSWPTNFRSGTDPNAPGDLRAEVRAFLDAGVDGMFSDHPNIAVDALEDWLERRRAS